MLVRFPDTLNPYQLPEHERQRCEVWTRVMGYHRPVSEFNPGKQCEHHERRHFDEPWPEMEKKDEGDTANG